LQKDTATKNKKRDHGKGRVPWPWSLDKTILVMRLIEADSNRLRLSVSLEPFFT
jgi:hypothetical protein